LRFAPRLGLSLLLACLLGIGQAQAQFGGRGISGLERNDTPRVLPAEEAFPFTVSARRGNEILLTWIPVSEHYLYRHRFAFSLLNAGEEAIPLSFSLPAGKSTEDEFFGAIEAYFDAVTVTVDLGTVPNADSELEIHYQGCAEWGFCYPPQVITLAL